MLEGGLSNLGMSISWLFSGPFYVPYINDIGTPTVPKNTYKAVRLLSDEYNSYYSVWCNNEHKLYNLRVSPFLALLLLFKLDPLTDGAKTDPYQVKNLQKSEHESVKILRHLTLRIISRLDTLLIMLKSCRGSQCIKSWDLLHPDSLVTSLTDTIDPIHDGFYESQPKVSFSHCAYGYKIEAEGPQEALSYRNGYKLEHWV